MIKYFPWEGVKALQELRMLSSIQGIMLFFLFLDTFRVHGILLFFLFQETFHIQRIPPFLLFLDTWTDVGPGPLRAECHSHEARREKFTR